MHFKFDYEADHHFEQMLSSLMAIEINQGNKSGVDALCSQIEHYKETHRKCSKTRERRNLCQNEEDIQSLKQFLATKLNEAWPSRDEILKFGAITFQKRMHFLHQNGLTAGCTAFMIRIATKETMDTFKISEYK